MQILGEIQHIQRAFSCGGCEVLRLAADSPEGNTPAAAHCAEAVRALCDYAEATLFPDAAAALTAAAREGRAYLFARRRYRIALSEAPLPHGHRITLTVTLSENNPRTGSEILDSRTLETFWDEAGEIQTVSGKRAKQKRWRKRGQEPSRAKDVI